MEMISEDKLRHIAGSKGLNLVYIEKDYVLTTFLYLIRNVNGIHLKGGTALNKLFLNHARLSEDIDFAVSRGLHDIKEEIESLVKGSKLFTKIETDKTTKDFVRYIVHYKSYFREGSFILVDFNTKASVLLEPEIRKVPNFYGLDFSIPTLNIREIVAEKIRALITRNQPRDYFDAYHILKKFGVDIPLVRKKVKEAGEEYDTGRIYRNANRVYSHWDEEIGKLTNRKLSFLKCISLIKKHLPKE